MALGRLHPSDEYDIRIAVEEGEGGSLDGKWIAMLVDEIEHYSGENARLTALLAERDAEIKALVEALRQGIELGEAWERVDNPEAAGEWSMYLLPDFMEAARAALAGSREQAQGEGAR